MTVSNYYISGTKRIMIMIMINLPKIIAFAAILLSSLIFSSLDPVKAQTPTDEFVTYQNPAFAFSLQHPSNWKVDEDRSSDGIVQFFTAKDDDFAIFSVSVHNVTRYLNTDTLSLKDTTAQEYALKRLNILSQMGSDMDFKQIRQNEFNIAGNSGWKIEYSVNPNPLMELPKGFTPPAPSYQFEVFTVANGKIYTLRYAEEPMKVPDTLPLVNKTVESFRIL